MYKLVSQQFASEIDRDVFGENLLKLHYFIAAFNKAVKKKTEDPCGKQTQPIKYTTGEEKEIIKKCIKLPLKERYETAKQMMYQLWGHSHKVIVAYCKEIKQWPQIRLGDTKAYRKFGNLIVNDPVFSKEAVEQYIDKKVK